MNLLKSLVKYTLVVNLVCENSQEFYYEKVFICWFFISKKVGQILTD